jgi:hypothetical protein
MIIHKNILVKQILFFLSMSIVNSIYSSAYSNSYKNLSNTMSAVTSSTTPQNLVNLKDNYLKNTYGNLPTPISGSQNYQQLCQNCSCDLNRNLLTCNPCNDNNFAKNLSFPGLCTDFNCQDKNCSEPTYKIVLSNGYLTPDSGILYEFMNLASKVKNIKNQNSPGYQNQFIAKFIDQLNTFAQYQFPVTLNSNQTSVFGSLNFQPAQANEPIKVPDVLTYFNPEAKYPDQTVTDWEENFTELEIQDFVLPGSLASLGSSTAVTPKAVTAANPGNFSVSS